VDSTAAGHVLRMSFELVAELLELRVLPEDCEPNVGQGRRGRLRVHTVPPAGRAQEKDPTMTAVASTPIPKFAADRSGAVVSSDRQRTRWMAKMRGTRLRISS
jgi:hypothetical protein